LRQALVITQFAASVALVVGTYSIYRQLNYMKSQELGVQIDQTLVLRGPNVTDSTYTKKLSAFKNELLLHPAIKKVTASSEVPGNKVGWNAGGIRLVGSDPNKSQQYRVFGVDHDFIDAYGLKVLKGRNFDEKFASDSSAVVFNEAAIKLLGVTNPDEALNKKIDFWGDEFTIVGIVSNHHQESLKQDFDAYIFRLTRNADDYYSLKIDAATGAVNDVIKTAEKKWATFFPGNPFEYFFLNDHFATQYKADEQFGRTFGLFAVLAIIVACLGLFGLASFVTTQRTKEIGIRKISGASISAIVVLLTRDFIKPVLIAFAIATPITYYLLQQWLQNYAFKTDVTFWMFLIPCLLILLIAMITVSTQTVRAASVNPVKSLRTE
jgi:putative ABC transport system permease protein